MPVPSEDLIKYGHRISASNAVSAPLNWQQGDPRRPYPTDGEMRLGFLARPESAIVAEQQQRLNAMAAAQQQQAAMAAAAAARSSMHQQSPMHEFSSFGHHGSPSKHGMEETVFFSKGTF
jgi:mediator of RNA polymerase II transcription subunit 4